MNPKWLAQTTIYRDSVDLVAVIDHGQHGVDVAAPMRLTLKRQEQYSAIAEPTLSLQPQSARSLMQALWDAGIRPADWSSPVAEVKAMRQHIAFAEHVGRTLLERK